ncbi:MAG: thymidine phosphorylase [Elusimicrobia bacterium]|nr:thymidine phosphorylase [Elusimicrobiota bacterium]
MLDLILKKRSKGEHSPQELSFIAASAAAGSVPDYQIASWLMAAFLNGMTERETVALTRAMAASGRRLSLRGIGKKTVDKHSTGGVGDGISLALAPAVAACGVCVPMMSGRGLGHTGGTLDKLESIAGMKVRLDVPRIEAQLKSIGVCMFGQSEDLNPADRKLYALRDATATVESMPLIVASILSKKVAEDLDALVLDIKCGSGAFLSRQADAVELGRRLVKTAGGLGIRCVGLVTSMDQPLGRAVGNASEMRQAIDVLRGDASCGDYVELVRVLGGWMVHLAGKAKGWEEGARRIDRAISSGEALAALKAMIAGQGGDAAVIEDPKKLLPDSPHARDVVSPSDGYVVKLDARAIGGAAVALGAGRGRMEDAIEFGAGIRLEKKLGDPVRKGEAVARLFAEAPEKLDAGQAAFQRALAIGRRKVPAKPLIRKVIR